MQRQLASTALGAALFALAGAVRAQACCTATGSSELGVVGRCHFAVLASQLSYDRGFGSVDARGKYQSLDGSRVDDAVLTLAGGVRLGTPALQAHAAVPLRLQHRELRGLPAATRLGPGDASLGLRAMVVEDLVAGLDLSEPRTLLPFIELFVAGRFPTGRDASDSDTPTQADVTGEGAWSLLGGAQITKFVTLHQAVVATGSYARRFPHDVTGANGQTRRYAPGDEVDAKLAYVNVFDLFWSATLFSTARFTARAANDGVAVPDSDTRRVRFGGGVSHYLSYPYWQLTFSASFDPPVDDFAKNVPFASVTAGLTVQRNFTY
ncbi:MAG: hypothetical protein L6Q84_29245 [Polyangiaceae bacterium]|nr:hypothetical protein [Polyangiaceae bacterium]